MKKSTKIGGISLVGIMLLLGLAGAAVAQDMYSLTPVSNANWDIGTDNSNNLYIMWANTNTLYFGKVVNHAVTGQQTVVTDAKSDKYGWPRLSVQPNGQSMSIVYRSTSSTLKHAWRNSGGVWTAETIPVGTIGLGSLAGAVGGDGTVHATIVISGVLYYTYKKPGSSWVSSIIIDNDSAAGCSGVHMANDASGGIHINWMPYAPFLRYRYAAAGHTLDESATIKVNGNFGATIGSGDVYGTPDGKVHMIIGYGRALYHTYNTTPNGSFTTPTLCSGGPYYTDNDHHSAIGVDGSGKVYVSWGEQYATSNYVKLSVKEDGVWTIYTVDPESNINTWNKPGIAINSQGGFLLWRHKDNHLYLGEYIFNSLKVTAPNGGESMTPGSSQEISWTAEDMTGNIKIELLKGQTVLGTIVNNLGITSSPYTWTAGNYLDPAGAPHTAPIASDYLIKISTADNTYTDSSDANFSLANPSLSLTAPNGGESWVVGSSQTIAWTSTGTIANVQIEYSSNEGADWTEVIASTPNNGSYSWTIPNTVSSQCLVRISDDADMYVSDVSNAVFAITASLIPSITVTAPAIGAQWQRGFTYAITWTKNAAQNAYVKINLYKGTGTLVKILVSKTENDGSFNWLVPSSVAAGSTYFIRVQTLDALVRGNSSTFTIIVPSITVTAPTSGTIWAKSGTQTITWSKTGIQDENVKIQLRKGTKLISTLATTTANDGSFDWTIPTTLTPASNYKIRIITVNGLIVATGSLFTITN